MTSENTGSIKFSPQLSEGSIIPHLLLPSANILALASPPFKGRGLLWSSLIAYLAYFSLVDNCPSDPQVRYGISCVWVFYLPTIEKLLFSQPEQTYWRLGRARAEAASIPFGFQKLRWAAALWINPRGIGWNYQINGVPPANNSNYRWWFVLRQLFWFICFYVVVVVTTVYLTKYPYLGDPDSMTWKRSVLTELDIAVMIACAWQLQWTIASVIGVASGLSQPRDWPPLFGRLREVTTIRNFWGSFWHQILRQVRVIRQKLCTTSYPPLSGFGHTLINVLRIHRGSYLSYLIELSVAFFISGFFHAITLISLPSSPPSYYTFRGLFCFFMSQVIAMAVEELVIACYRHFTGPTGDQMKQNPRTEWVTWKTMVGYAWVMGWLLYSGWWAADIYLRMKMWEIPKPLVEPLFRLFAEYRPRGMDTVGGWLRLFDNWVDGR